VNWTKVPKHNEETLERLMAGVPGVNKRKMFGCPVWFVNGNMLTGAHQESIFLRLCEADQEEILTKHAAVTNFAPMPGRIMREYVDIPVSVYGSEDEFGLWLKKALDYVGSLPVKEPKTRRTKENTNVNRR